MDDVWFTFKARVAAELRLKNNDLHSQTLLVWYALCSTAAGIATLRYPQFVGRDTDIYLAVLSVALLAISMMVTGRDFRGRALHMRTNHLELKNLYDGLKAGTIENSEKPVRYAKLLGDCENHSSYDDRYFRIFNKAGLENRRPTILDYVALISMLLGRVGAISVLYGLPLVLAFMGLRNGCDFGG